MHVRHGRTPGRLVTNPIPFWNLRLCLQHDNLLQSESFRICEIGVDMYLAWLAVCLSPYIAITAVILETIFSIFGW